MSRAEDLVGNVLHITPQSGDTINPLISGPIVTIIPEKIKLSYTLLDQARVSLSAIQPQYADPFSETERVAYAMAIARVYHALHPAQDLQGRHSRMSLVNYEGLLHSRNGL